MKVVRNRARLAATITLTWQIIALAAMSMVLCDVGFASEHAGMPDCPLHESAPACPVHAEKHGTHECDCPTIGCARADVGIVALFGIGILNSAADVPVPVASGSAIALAAESINPLARSPLSPPPRA
jgi:hypothetical protein